MALIQSNKPRLFSAFGYCLLSHEIFFPWLVETGQNPADISISRINVPLFPFSEENLLFSYPIHISGKPISQIYRCGKVWGMRMAQIGDFFLTMQEIFFIPCMKDYYPVLQAAVLSNVLAFWMELNGLRTLHGATLSWQGQAFGLLADSTEGKSTLAASLMQNGASLLSDDISAIEAKSNQFLVRSGYPALRLRFEQVEYFLGQQADLAMQLPKLDKALIPIGYPGWAQFESNQLEPSCFFLLKRMPANQVGSAEIQPLHPKEAVLALIRNSFVHFLPFLTGTSANRLEFLTRLASQIPIKQLIYPSGYEHLESVCATIKQDLANSIRKQPLFSNSPD